MSFGAKGMRSSPQSGTSVGGDGSMIGNRKKGAVEKDVDLPCADAFTLLKKYGKDASWTRHSVAVSKVATRFAEILSDGYTLDISFVRSAALLHDIGRCRDQHPIGHGVEGYRLLQELGHSREAFICASHLLFGLTNDEAVRYGLPALDFVPKTIEECLVPLADSLIEHDRPVTISERYASLRRRYRDTPFFFSRLARAEERARSFLDRFSREFNLSLEDVARDLFS